MAHALIIGDNMIVSRAIENRLAPHGFDSVDRAWTRHQATDLATHHRPELIVVGDSIADGSPAEVARDIAGACDAPVLLVTSGRVHLERHSPSRSHVCGPFHLVHLDTALASLQPAAREMELCA